MDNNIKFNRISDMKLKDFKLDYEQLPSEVKMERLRFKYKKGKK